MMISSAQDPSPPVASDDAPGLWVLSVTPDRDELDLLQARFGLHPLVPADQAEGRQAPKFERLADHHYLTLWDADPEDTDRTRSDIALIFNARDCLVIQHGPEEGLRDIEALLRSDSKVPVESPISAVYRILDAVVRDYVLIGAEIENELEQVEDEVFDSRIHENYRRIYRLRQRIGRIDRAVSGLAEAIMTGREELDSLMFAELRPYFTHLEHDLDGVAKLTTAEHAALDAVVASHESNVSSRQNQDMRTISAFAALLAIPTVIAGVYGMNFKNLPLVQWQWGWLTVSVAMVLIDIVVYVTFRRRGWLSDRGNGQDADPEHSS